MTTTPTTAPPLPLPRAEGGAEDLAGDLIETGTRLAALRRLAGAEEPLLGALVGAVAAMRGFLLSHDPDEEGSGGPWRVVASRSHEGEVVLNPLDKVILPLAERCREAGSGFFSADLCEDPIYPKLERERQPRTRSVLILPLPDPSELVYLDHQYEALEFDTTAATRVAALIAVLTGERAAEAWALERDRLVSQLREVRRRLRGSVERAPEETASRRPTSQPSSRRPGSPSDEKRAGGECPEDDRGVRGDFRDIVGQHPEIVEILQLIERIAPTQAPVLVHGESGTGKEMVARAIHRNSTRATGPFVSENCAALAENLLEAELFGHVQGAFTGAHEDRPGLFELASGGTLFLDEIGDTSPGLQKKLLRALQEHVVRRVGGQELVPVDVRIVSATNRDLSEMVKRGGFREDLYYRLNVIGIHVPALRDRRADIPLLVQHFLDQLNERESEAKEATPRLISALMGYPWPGNVRELQNEIWRAHALGDALLRPEDLSPRVTGQVDVTATSDPVELVLEGGSLREAQDAWEKGILTACLRRCGGNKAQVSAQLQIPKTTLYAKLRRHGLHG